MPAGTPNPLTPRYGVLIITSDPSTGIIEAKFKNDDLRRVLVVTTPVAFRWPVAGESWVIRQENGTWYLDSPFPSPSIPVTINDIAAGDLVLNSPTGVVHVQGSSDGSTDFTISAGSFPTMGTATLASGSVLVDNPGVTASSIIILTAQDNNTLGALRVTTRTPGVSFQIASSNPADHGLVAWQIWN